VREEIPNFVAVRAVAAQPLFVEEPLDTALQTNLVGVPTKPNRPAHPVVAAATKNQRSGGFENALQRCSPLTALSKPRTLFGAFWVPRCGYTEHQQLEEGCTAPCPPTPS